MKTITPKELYRNLVSSCLMIAIFATSSMFALAAPEKQPLMGELVVSGTNVGQNFVTVNGKQAGSGSTVYTSTTIATPESSSAVVNLGEVGRLELAPDSNANLNFNDNLISAVLSAGQIKVFNSAGVEVKIQTKDGIVKGESGQSNLFIVNAESAMTTTTAELGSVYLDNGTTVMKIGAGAQDDDEEKEKRRRRALLIALGIGAAAAVVIIVLATRGGDDEQTTVSPAR